MRITNTMMVNNMMNFIGKNLQRLDTYEGQLATGKKINVPSDDPVVAARALKLRTDVSEIDQFKKNVNDGQSWLDSTEEALSNVNDIFQRVRELTVQASSGSNTAADREKISSEIGQLKEQAVQLGNATYAGRYIFSGYQTDKPLLNEDGSFNVSVSTSENIRYEIGIGDDMDINIAGGELFNAGASTEGDVNGNVVASALISTLDFSSGTSNDLNLTVDGEAMAITIPSQVFDDNSSLALAIQNQINSAHSNAISDVAVKIASNRLIITSGSVGSSSTVTIDGGTAVANLGMTSNTSVVGVNGKTGKLISDLDNLIKELSSGSSTSISALLTNFDDDLNNISRVRADIGARSNRLELTSNRLDSDSTNFTKLMSENEDVDMAETIMMLKNEENVYNASLSGGAKIIQPTLVDFLK